MVALRKELSRIHKSQSVRSNTGRDASVVATLTMIWLPDTLSLRGRNVLPLWFFSFHYGFPGMAAGFRTVGTGRNDDTFEPLIIHSNPPVNSDVARTV